MTIKKQRRYFVIQKRAGLHCDSERRPFLFTSISSAEDHIRENGVTGRPRVMPATLYWSENRSEGKIKIKEAND